LNYTSVDIIYNPNSTGPSRDNARELKNQLQSNGFRAPVRLLATKYAGHAEKLAFRYARKSTRPLIVSASGDGGYNEVVNGVMRAQLKGAKPACTVLPSGNANDHGRTLQQKPLHTLILQGKTATIDLLKADFKSGGRKQSRYAHSYIGLGLTPVVAAELNKTSLNAVKELWIVLKTFWRFRPFKIKHGGTVIKLDSILFANIGQMAKVLTVAKNARPDDGLFEVVTFPHDSKRRLLRKLAKATLSELEPTNQLENYDFQVLKRMPVQFDGEVDYIDKTSVVKVSAEKKILRTVV
jgi:diacylglycerol kinase (ATP)